MVEVLKQALAVLEAEAETASMLASVDPEEVSWSPSEELKRFEAIEAAIQSIRHLLFLATEEA